MDQPSPDKARGYGTPRFGRLLLVLAAAVLLIIIITFASEAFYS